MEGDGSCAKEMAPPWEHSTALHFERDLSLRVLRVRILRVLILLELGSSRKNTLDLDGMQTARWFVQRQ